MASILGAILFAVIFLFSFDASYWNKLKDTALSKAIYAQGGELLGASVASDGQWRLKAGSHVSERFAIALISYEDRRFYGHAGFDTIAIIRAFLSNIKGRKILSGASTISMQSARLSRSPGPRSIFAKLLELWMAARLELGHNKDQILDIYSGLAPFGANVAGLEAAGFRWFGRAPEKLSWGEAACLAVLPNSPGLVHPGRSRNELKRKRDLLLNYLAKNSCISEIDLEIAIAEALPAEPIPMPKLAPHFLAHSNEGRTDTSLDYVIQSRANSIIQRHTKRLMNNGIENIAALIIRTEDNSLAAYIGNSPQESGAMSPWVDCILAPRSSGSILKPFLYAAMLDTGELNPAQLVPDIPTRVGSYSPENNLKTFSGAVRADAALALSLNVPFVRLLRTYGVERFASLLKNIGFTSLYRAPLDYGLPLILGGAEVSLLEAAYAYSFLARAAIADEDLLKPSSMEQEKLNGKNFPISAGAAYLCLEALVNVGRPGEDASWQEYASSRRIAWKTGTSFGSRDAWAIGVSKDWVVAVWTGNASGVGRPELKGSTSAAPIMFDLFELLPRSEWFKPDMRSLRFITVCSDSGFVAGPNCSDTKQIMVPVLAKTYINCPYCIKVQLNKDRTSRVRPDQYGGEEIITEKRFVLPPAMELYYAMREPGYKLLPPWAEGMAAQKDLDFLAPEENSWIYVPIELDGSLGKTVFRAVHRKKSAKLFWHLDGDYIGETLIDHRMEARPGQGRHELVIVDDSGNSLKRVFFVYERE